MGECTASNTLNTPALDVIRINADFGTAKRFHCERAGAPDLRTAWAQIDSYLTALHIKITTPRHGFRDLCNKPTAFYFEQPTQSGRSGDMQGYSCIKRKIIASANKTWRTLSSDAPDL
jgi:hypothetical protein